MRKISPLLQERLEKKVQAKSTEADPRLDAWVSRPFTAITDPLYLEVQPIFVIDDEEIDRPDKVKPNENLRNPDIAVRHSYLYRQSSEIYIAYISPDNILNIKSAEFKNKISATIWASHLFNPQADDVSLCFDATMKKTLVGREEFLTDRYPWVFWTYGGVLYGRKLYSEKPGEEPETITLSTANTHRVSAVRGSTSFANAFDFGLIVFFVMSGKIYYRQLISGEWYDAELVSLSGLENVTFIDVAASRTWDYRIVLQCKAEDGKIYEIYSQFGGIGTRTAEHLNILNITGLAKLEEIKHTDLSNSEHINIVNIKGDAPFGGLYELGSASMLSAHNVEDENGDFGKIVIVTFDRHLNPTETAENSASFSLIDTRGYVYTPSTATVTEDGYSVKLEFKNINNAEGDCKIVYTPGTISTMYGEPLSTLECTFTPEGLVPTGIPAPVPVEAWNVGNLGTTIYLRFSNHIQSPDISANLDKFKITFDEYDATTDSVVRSERTPISLAFADPDQELNTIIIISLAEGNQNNLEKAIGDITIEYAGGNINGNGEPVQRFEFAFTPEELAYKGDQNNKEHLEIAEISATGTLTKVTHKNVDAPAEHLQILNITAVGTLTHIDDI